MFSAVFVFRTISQGRFTFETVGQVVSIGFSLAFLYVRIALPRFLNGSVPRITALLYISTGWSVFVYLMGLVKGFSPFGLCGLLLVLLILWYLLKNVRRLAAGAQASSLQGTPLGPE